MRVTKGYCRGLGPRAMIVLCKVLSNDSSLQGSIKGSIRVTAVA